MLRFSLTLYISAFFRFFGAFSKTFLNNLSNFVAASALSDDRMAYQLFIRSHGAKPRHNIGEKNGKDEELERTFLKEKIHLYLSV